VSTAIIGLVMGGGALVGLPLQPFAGALSDRHGRRAVMMGCALCEAVACAGLAFAHGCWPICVLMVIDRGVGWPLYLHLPEAGWGVLVSVIGLVTVLAQVPTVRAVRRLDPLHAVAPASLLYGAGMGLAAFVPPGWPLVATAGMLAVATALPSPLATTAVSHLAAPELRGRYMGAWTVVWTGCGSAPAPLPGGLVPAALGPQAMCATLLAVGAAGAGLYSLLRAKGPAPLGCGDRALVERAGRAARGVARRC
jgi:MFS family permease